MMDNDTSGALDVGHRLAVKGTAVRTVPIASAMTPFENDSPELAQTYDRLSEMQFQGGKRLVERMGVKQGDRVLDVGCGTGRLAEWIAKVVGPTGAVCGIDPLADRVALARDRNPGIPFSVGQAEDLTAFPAEAFDAVCLAAVFHWVQDKPKALAEIHRVLRSGGAVGFTTLPRELHRASTMATVCGPIFGRPPYRELLEQEISAFANYGVSLTALVSMVLEAGFQVVKLIVAERTRVHRDEAEVIDFVESSAFGNFLGRVPEALRASLRTELAAAFAQRKTPDGIVVREHGVILVGRRPAGDASIP